MKETAVSICCAAGALALVFWASAARAESSFEPESRLAPLAEAVFERLANWRNELTAAASETKTSAIELAREFRTPLASARKSVQSFLKQRREERAEKEAAQAAQRLVRETERLEQITGRLKTRLEKIAASGGDTASAEALLTRAAQHVEAAVQTSADAAERLRRETGTRTAEETWATIEAETQAVRDKVKTAHGALVGVINAVK